MRFVAPDRHAVDRARFEHPAFQPIARHFDLLAGDEWPGIERLNARLGARAHPHSGAPLRFVAQTRALLADGMHYESRILEQGAIATRPGNWHDLLNALVWIEHTALKAALNLRQAADVGIAGPGLRTRAQCALTHFDEAGAIAIVRDDALLQAWDAHDWRALFDLNRKAWIANGRAPGVELVVFGHALLEHLLAPQQTVVARCIAVTTAGTRDACVAHVAQAIARGDALADPQALRPLPLAGIPGWDPRADDPAFLREAECFRPLRPGRQYPAPIPIQSWMGPS